MPENNAYHNTLLLFKNYRAIVQSVTNQTRQADALFLRQYGITLDEYLEAPTHARSEFAGTKIERVVRAIARNRKMIAYTEAACEEVRKTHRNGELYYSILYYSYMSPEEHPSINDILTVLQEHGHNIKRAYFFKARKSAIDAVCANLWGLKDSEIFREMDIENNK